MAGTKYSAEMRSRAVRLVREHSGDYPSEWAAIGAVAQRLGIGSAETLRKWLRQAEVDDGKAPGTTAAEAAEIGALKRKVSELERTLEILTEATRFFAREADPLRR
jgi:transposase